jgi:two-component system response regulator
MHQQQVILLVEDNADDEALTLRALRKNNITNKVVVAHDGVEATDYLFGSGFYAGRDPNDLPHSFSSISSCPNSTASRC